MGNKATQQLSDKEIWDIKATSSALKFRDQNPDYYPTEYNSIAIQKYIKDKGLDPFRSSSFQQAFDAQTLAGELEVEHRQTTPEPIAEEPAYEPLPARQVLTDGRAIGYHRPDQVEALKKLPLRELKKIVNAETSATRASLQRRGIKV